MSPLNVEYLTDGEWRLTEDLEYEHPEYGVITVPAGTVTDLDSVPRLPFAYWLVKNCSVIGATVHDYLYATGRLDDRTITRAEADRIFLDAMQDEGVSWWQRRMIYTGVRLGGRGIWRRYREAQKNKA